MNAITSAALEEWAILLSKALLHSLWEGAIIAILVAIVARWFATSAALRSTIYLAGMAGIVVSFLLTCFLLHGPSVSISRVSGPAHEQAGSAPDLAVGARTESVTAFPVSVSSEITVTGNAIEASPPDRWVVIARCTAVTYLLGVLLMASRLVCGMAGTRRLRSKAQKIEDRGVLKIVDRISAAIVLRVKPAVAYSSGIVTPAVVGILRPMILLPVGMLSGIPAAQVEAIIAHELAHLRRLDHIGLLIQRFVETVAFYHPAAWWLSKKLADAREESCDDIVLSCGCDRADYAESLISMNAWAQSAMTSHHGPLVLGVAGRKLLLRKRLFRILGVAPEPARRRRFSCDGGLLGALVILLICGFASVPFLVKASEETSEGATRIPRLHPVEREAIEKIERLVERSQAFAKTEDGMVKEYSEPPQSEKLMDEAVQLLEIHCSYGSHPELLHLHRRVNLLAGRPEHAEAFQSWIVPSGHYRLAREFRDEEQWQAAEAEYRKSFETRPEINGGWDAGYIGVLVELRKFDEAVEFIRLRAAERTRGRLSSFSWGDIDDFPAVPVPLFGSYSTSSFTGSRILSGELSLSFTVGADGRASLNETVSPVDGIPLFPEKIQEMVSRWRFAPRKDGGVPVATSLEIPFRYVTSLPSVWLEVDNKVNIQDIRREVSKNVMTYGVCEARIQVQSDTSYPKVLQAFKACVENGATVLGVREENRSDARIPAPPPPPPDINLTKGYGTIRLNHKPAMLEEVTEAIRQYEAEYTNPIQLSAHTAADSSFVDEVKAACEQVSVRPVLLKRFSGYTSSISIRPGEISADGKTMLVSRPNRDGLPLLSVSSLQPDVGDQPDQPFSLPVRSEGSVSLDGQSVSFDEISNWRSLAKNLTGTKPGAVRLLLKPDVTFGYALDVFEACQREGGADISVSILGAP